MEDNSFSDFVINTTAPTDELGSHGAGAQENIYQGDVESANEYSD